jgi:hypothetical protein
MGTGPPEVATHALSKRRDEELQALVKQLDDAYARKHDLGESGEPTAEIAREILGRRAGCRGVLPGKRCGMAVVGTGPGR